MKVLFDTSVLYPALDPVHPLYERCKSLIAELEKEHSIVVLNTHLIAELFNNLSKQPRMPTPLAVINTVVRDLAKRYTGVELTMNDYLLAIDRCTKLGLRGGVIYDALHFQAAIKANVDIIYTGNLRDFKRLMTDEITFTIKSPL